jgi:hypothetical protein
MKPTDPILPPADAATDAEMAHLVGALGHAQVRHAVRTLREIAAAGGHSERDQRACVALCTYADRLEAYARAAGMTDSAQ